MMNLAAQRLSGLFFGHNLTHRQKTTTRTLGGIGLVLAVVGAAIAGVFLLGAASSNEAAGAKAARVLPVETVTVSPIDSYTSPRSYTGVLVAARTSELSFELAGKVVEIYVDQGDSVIAGQVVASLATRQLRAKRDQLQAQRDQAAAVLAELEAGPRQEKIAAAQAEVRDLKSQADWQEARHLRRDDLHRRKVIAAEEFDESRFAMAAARARHDAAARRLDELLTGTRQEQIDAQRAAVAGLDAAVAQIDVDLQDSSIEAPFSGTIARRHIDEGSVVSAGVPVVRLVENAALEAHVGLPPRAARQLSIGGVHQIKVAKDQYPAEVSAILPELDAATRTRTVVFQLDEAAAHTLVPGEIARVEVAQRVDAEGFWLPTAALARGTRGLWSALAVVRSPDKRHWRAERRYVEVLHTEADRVLARGTIEPGDLIVAAGVHRVVDGQSVQPIGKE